MVDRGLMESFLIGNKINYRKLRPFLAQLIIESPNLGFPQKMQERGIIESNDNPMIKLQNVPRSCFQFFSGNS